MTDRPRNRVVDMLPCPPLEEWQKDRKCLLRMIDYAIVEGARLRAPAFVHYLRLAHTELEKMDASGSPTKKH